MSGKFELYIVDTETTGLSVEQDIIELSIYRLSNDNQKTWRLKPLNSDDISADALRVNGHKLEDILGKTKEGKERYIEADKVLVEIEQWLAEDFVSSEERVLVGQNINFDKTMLEALWTKCNSIETYPFNKRYMLDTMQIEIFMDYCKKESSEGYSLFGLCKKYGVKNDKAHSASADTRACRDIFVKQVEAIRKFL